MVKGGRKVKYGRLVCGRYGFRIDVWLVKRCVREDSFIEDAVLRYNNLFSVEVKHQIALNAIGEA